jgi:hypothetical protein
VEKIASHSSVDDNEQERVRLTWKCAMTLHNDGRYEEAKRAVRASDAVGDEDPYALTSMHNLALTLQLQARCEEALALMETCFQLRQQVLGE